MASTSERRVNSPLGLAHSPFRRDYIQFSIRSSDTNPSIISREKGEITQSLSQRKVSLVPRDIEAQDNIAIIYHDREA